jgi:undecaprenyl-diphosphatase
MLSRTGAHAVFRWIGQHELGSVLSVVGLASATWVFVEVADEVREGETHGIDHALLLALRSRTNVADPLGPRWLEEMGRDLSALGGAATLTLLTIAVIGYFFMLRKPRAAAFVGVSVVGAVLLSTVLKRAFARPRPDVVPHLSHVFSASFPSGHSMVSTAVYLTLGALLARLHSNLVIKAYVLMWAVLLALLVGLSRVYVGVHWPTDVLGGWAAGAAWAASCWLVARWFQRRGVLELPANIGNIQA